MNGPSSHKESLIFMRTQPYLGYGLGLRKEHYETILRESLVVDWFEILSAKHSDVYFQEPR